MAYATAEFVSCDFSKEVHLSKTCDGVASPTKLSASCIFTFHTVGLHAHLRTINYQRHTFARTNRLYFKNVSLMVFKIQPYLLPEG